jgi:hypothetical protein
MLISKMGDRRAQSYHCRVNADPGFFSSGHASFAGAGAGQQHGYDRPYGMRRRFSACRWTLRAQYRCAPIPARHPSV